MKNVKSKAYKIIIPLLALTLLIGTFAYFADRVSTTASISTVGAGEDGKSVVEITPLPDPTVEPDDPNLPGPGDYEDETPENPEDDLTNWWAYLNSKAKVNFNPGDKMTLNYILKNSGILAVDVRETFIVTSSKPLSDTPEFRLFTSVTNDTAGANFGDTVVVSEEKLDDTHYKYVVAPYTLNSATDTVDGVNETERNREYYLVFDALSSNDFQGAVCSIDYVVEAKQHTDSDADWTIAATGSLAFDGYSINVVPAA